MERSPFLTRLLVGVLALTMVMIPLEGFAQQEPAGAVTFSQQDLDQMIAPIALYPDSLLAQVLIAATYPDQVMEADRWLKGNPNLKGEALNSALDTMNWDLSVKALAPFPQVVAMMAQEPDWTQRLGEAFLGQQAQVMDTVQKLRHKAQAAGNLKSSAEQKVVVKSATAEVGYEGGYEAGYAGGVTTDYIEIEPVNPQVVYVPRYDPVVVYGSWWWPTPPYVYAPVWPGVAVGVGIGVGFGFFGGVAVGPVWNTGWGRPDWGHGDFAVNSNRSVNINSTNVNVTRNITNNMKSTSLTQAKTAGQIGSGKAKTIGMNAGKNVTGAKGGLGGAKTGAGVTGTGLTGGSKTGAGTTGAGKTGAGLTGGSKTGTGATVGGGAGGSRPSATSVMQGLKQGGSGGAGGGSAGTTKGGSAGMTKGGSAGGTKGGALSTGGAGKTGTTGGGSRTLSNTPSKATGGSSPTGSRNTSNISRGASQGGAKPMVSGGSKGGSGAPKGGSPKMSAPKGGGGGPKGGGGSKGGGGPKGGSPKGGSSGKKR